MDNTLSEEHIELLRNGSSADAIYVVIQLIEAMNPKSERPDLTCLESRLWMAHGVLSDLGTFVERFSTRLGIKPK